NFTAIQTGVNNNSNNAAIFARGNADLTLVNGVVYAPQDECIRVNGTGTTATRATLTAQSVVMTCASSGAFLGTGSYANADVQAAFNAGSNNNAAFTSTLASTFVNGANEAGVVAYANIKSLSSYFDAVTYVGAVKDAADTWYRGWTCDTATANFGSNSACTALPVT
ncbi:MAG: hypothetical protein IE935_11885, partial [Micrococcales bacterium]|nr:hypothetical protein [Micrococcales bacterium]